MDLEEMGKQLEEKEGKYDKTQDLTIDQDYNPKDEQKDKRLEAGQSKRIWEELYKVLDSSDVIV